MSGQNRDGHASLGVQPDAFRVIPFPRRVPIRPRAQRRNTISAEAAFASCAGLVLSFALGFAAAAFFVVPILLGVHR